MAGKYPFGNTVRAAVAWALVSLLVILALPAVAVAQRPNPSYPTGFSERVIASGLGAPTSVAWAPDGRMFIAEKDGRLEVVEPGTSTVTEILDISARVNVAGDRGLLGLAVDANYASNNFVYLLYTYDVAPLTPDNGDTRTVSRLERFTVSPTNVVTPDRVLLGSYVEGACPPARNDLDCVPSDDLSHSIGTVRADPDGTLWVGSGDAASFGFADPLALRTYDERSMAGKILHIDRNGRGLPGHAFCPSNGNLDDVCTKVHAKGFRNPYRFTLRPDGGGLVVGDVGWNQREEIDVVTEAGGNYGWPCHEASQRTPSYRDWPECEAEYAKEGTPDAHRPPGYEYLHTVGSTVVSGPTYNGGRYPSSIDGDVFYGDYAAKTIRRLVLDEQNRVTETKDFATNWNGMVGLEMAPNGNLVGIDIGTFSQDGAIREIVYENSEPVAVASATPTSGPTPLTVDFTGSSSFDPDDQGLTYDWDFGDGSAHSASVNPRHVYTGAGVFTARLTVSDGQGNSDSATVTIRPGTAAPTAAIATPADGSLYRNGNTVTVSGSGTDAQDGHLPASALDWRVLLHHGDHIHPLHQQAGSAQTSFTAAIDHDADSYYEITLTARDSSGLAGSRSITLRPETAPARITSTPSGAPVTYGGRDFSAPLNTPTAVGFRTSLSADPQFVRDGRPFYFHRWSDDGPRARDGFTVSPAGFNLRAYYREDKAFARTASASSTQFAGLEPDQAVDGDPQTRWGSAFADNEHWQVDLGSQREVDHVRIDWTAAYPLRYLIQTSANGATWSTAATQDVTPVPHGTSLGVVETDFATRSARFVRIQSLQRATNWGVSFWDAQVLGPADSATLPDTTITSGPTGAINVRDASFGFASEPGAEFECRLATDAWHPCTSPHALTELADGTHSFQVRALTDAGEDPTPATRSFTVDTAAPETTIDAGPSGTITTADTTFGFSSEPSATFECKLDQGSWSSCTSEHQLTNLPEGAHTFDVRATDAAGNTDQSPATRAFTVDVADPPVNPPPVTKPAPEPRTTPTGDAHAYATMILRTRALGALFGFGDAGPRAADAKRGPAGWYRGRPRRVSPLLAGGQDAWGRAFDGRDDRIDLDPRALGAPRPFSIEVWVRPRGTRRHTGYVLAGAHANGRGAISLAIDPRGRPVLRVSRGRHMTRVVGPALGRRVRHLVTTYDGQRLRLYVDGRLRRTARHRAGVAWKGNRRLTVGTDARRRSHFAGTLDELALYDRALSASIVRQHSAAGR